MAWLYPDKMLNYSSRIRRIDRNEILMVISAELFELFHHEEGTTCLVVAQGTIGWIYADYFDVVGEE